MSSHVHFRQCIAMNVMEADFPFAVHASIVTEFMNVQCFSMYGSGERIVPVDPGVCSIVQLVMVLSLAMILRIPVPIATHDGSSVDSSL